MVIIERRDETEYAGPLALDTLIAIRWVIAVLNGKVEGTTHRIKASHQEKYAERLQEDWTGWKEFFEEGSRIQAFDSVLQNHGNHPRGQAAEARDFTWTLWTPHVSLRSIAEFAMSILMELTGDPGVRFYKALVTFIIEQTSSLCPMINLL